MAAALMPLTDIGLTPGARLVLVGMCNMAVDNADPPIYYGGWVRLAEGLGHATYGPTPERAVARAIAELRKAGLIVPNREAVPGRNVEYEIRL